MWHLKEDTTNKPLILVSGLQYSTIVETCCFSDCLRKGTEAAMVVLQHSQ